MIIWKQTIVWPKSSVDLRTIKFAFFILFCIDVINRQPYVKSNRPRTKFWPKLNDNNNLTHWNRILRYNVLIHFIPFSFIIAPTCNKRYCYIHGLQIVKYLKYIISDKRIEESQEKVYYVRWHRDGILGCNKMLLIFNDGSVRYLSQTWRFCCPKAMISGIWQRINHWLMIGKNVKKSINIESFFKILIVIVVIFLHNNKKKRIIDPFLLL